MQKAKINNVLFILLFSMFVLSTNNQCFALDVKSELQGIETEMWGFSHDNENDIERIERIEKQIFGITNPKLTPEERIKKITNSLGLETRQEAASPLSDLYAAEQAGEGVEYPQVDRMESLILGSVYKSDNIYKRLERLEKKAFGAKQEGELSQRTEALKNHCAMNYYAKGQDTKESYKPDYPDNSYYDSDTRLQISALENMLFQTSYSNEPISQRLNRLEMKIFQRGFADDDDRTRVQRIQAAATAGKTAKYYDNNKFQKFASTGMQAASILLMILAFIL